MSKRKSQKEVYLLFIKHSERLFGRNIAKQLSFFIVDMLICG